MDGNTRNKLSAGVIIIRERQRKGAPAVASANVRQGSSACRGAGKKCFFESLSQCRKLAHIAENEPTPYLYTLRRTVAYACTLPNAIAYPNTLSRLHILIHCRLASAANLNWFVRHPSHQPIRIEYYVSRVVSQSESSITSAELSITSPESSRLGLKTLLGSRLESAHYSPS